MLKLNAIGLFVSDMEKMVSFYRDVMGMETEWAGEANADLFSGGIMMIMFSRNDFEQMTSRKYTYPSGLNGTVEISFNVDSFSEVDKQYEKVVAGGATSVFPPTDEPWGQRTCYVSDPDGNLIEISSFNKD